MRVLVYAGRDYKDRDKVFEVLDGLHRAHAAPIGDHKPELVVAFPGGRGTAHMVHQARGASIKVVEVL